MRMTQRRGRIDTVLLLVLVCASALAPRTADAQSTRPDTLSGRLTTDSARAIADAEIIVTRGPDRTVFRTRTDSAGRWRVIADPGSGDYLVYASAPGRTPIRKRITRETTETHFTVDVALAPAQATALAQVEVRATKRERVDRSFNGLEPSLGDAAIDRDGVNAAVPGSRAGDIAANAGTVAGLLAGPGGISALGLPGSQSLVTLNGLAFAGGELPRGAFTMTSVSTTAYDVARGGFSGAQVDVSLMPGSTFMQNRATVIVDAPQLQVTDAAGRALGSTTRRIDANVALTGPLTGTDRYAYASAFRLRRADADVPSLLSANRRALDAAGVATDTVARLLGLLNRQGVPIGTTRGTSRTDVQFVGRLDRLAYDPIKWEPTPRTYGILGYVDAHDERGVGLGPTAMPSASASTRDVTSAVQLSHSYQGSVWLHDTRTALSIHDIRTTPAFLLPSASVRTVSSNADAGGIASLAFGGNDYLAGNSTRLTWETTQESQVYARAGTRHKVKLYAQSRIDASTEAATPNALGTYRYNSLDDLGAGVPATFSRTLAQPERKGTVFNGAIGVGSVYRRSASFSMQYGARLESNAFLSRPDANPALLQSLGLRTNVAPTDIGVSPRVGFRWVYQRRRGDNGGMTFTSLGTLTTEPRGVLRGGFGEFRSYINPETIAGPVAATGLSGSTLQLLCLDQSVPAPDWDTFTTSASTIPSQCVNGAPALADRTPGVRTLDPSYRPPRSWRANLAWTTRLLHTDLTVEGIASLNIAQPSSVDANFSGVPRFTLDAESGRPVFANAGSIVPGTGAVSAVDARRDAAIGSVLVAGSHARSTSTQLRVVLTPSLPFKKRLQSVRLTWVGAAMHAQENGFDRNTGGDPRAFETTTGDLDRRQQLIANAGIDLGKGFGVSMYVNATSGLPYTPLVRGDINGDGLGFNDRAFVTAGTSADPAFARAMTSLLSSAPSAARSCLLRSIGRIAARNTCRGPWQATMNMQLAAPATWLGLPRDAMFNVYFENPLAGVDQLLHGNAIRGWGAPAIADPVLYSVRGFDAATRRFLYDVNPRFGSTDPRLSGIRAPFRVTLELQAPFGPPLPQQQLKRALRDGRNGDRRPRRDAKSLQQQYERSVPNIYGGILEESDSLFISKEQTVQLQSAKARYDASVDSIWGDLATYLVSLPDVYDAKEALKHQEAAIDAVWETARAHALALDAILTPQQLRLLPWPASYLRSLDRSKKVRIRMFLG